MSRVESVKLTPLVSNVDALASKKASVKRPGAGSYQSQGGTVGSHRMRGHRSPGCKKANHNSKTATSAPAMGVHNPVSRSAPASAASTWSMVSVDGP